MTQCYWWLLDYIVRRGNAVAFVAEAPSSDRIDRSRRTCRAAEPNTEAPVPSEWLTEAELLLLHTGNALLWSRLYSHYTPSLLARARAWSRSSDDAEDMVQATWARAYEKRAHCRSSAAVGAWLHRICRNIVVDSLRARKRRVAGEAALRQLLLVAHHEPMTEESKPLWTSDTEWLREHIQRLPARQREVGTLRWILGYSTRETAKRLGLAQGTVKATLHHVRETLRGWRLSQSDPR